MLGYLLDTSCRMARRRVSRCYEGAGLADSRDPRRWESTGRSRANLAQRWIESGLMDARSLHAHSTFGDSPHFGRFPCGPSQMLCPVTEGRSPDTQSRGAVLCSGPEGNARHRPRVALQDALYVEKISRLLPTYSISSRTDDDVVLGYWLTGGASVSAKSFRRLRQTMSWLGASHLKDVVKQQASRWPR